MTEATYETIPAERLPRLEEKFEKIVRRAKRLRIDPPRLTVVGVREVLEETGYRDMYGQTIYKTKHVADVCVEGERPQVEGWVPVANLVWTTPEAGNVVRAREGFEVSHDYRFRHACDHCGHDRARKETWLFQHVESGELKQIGRTCVQDFVGSTVLNPSMLALWADAWGSLGDDEMGCGGPMSHGVGDYLAAAAACIRVFGFMSRSRVRDTGQSSTADDAFLVLNAERMRMSPSERADKGIPELTGDDYMMANKALEWIESDDTDRRSDYIHNVYASCKMGYVTHKTAGYVASLVGAAYPNAMKREAEVREKEAANANKKVSEYIGEEKKRLDLGDLKVTKVRGWEGNYGYTTLVRFEDKDGNELQWFASGDREDAFNEGETCVNVRATIKRHDRDKVTGNKVTTVNRLVVGTKPS